WLEEAQRARRRLADLGPGLVTFEGVFRCVGDGRGVVEEGEARVLVDCPVLPPDGSRVLVSGFATHAEGDLSGSNYRASAKRWVVDARERAGFVTADLGAIGRGIARARLRALFGGLLFGLGTGLAIAAVAILRHQFGGDA